MLKLEAQTRDVFGKKLKSNPPAGGGGKKGKIPAVVYGPKNPTVSIFIPAQEFEKIWKQAGESEVINLEIEGKGVEVLIHDVDINPITDEPRHADFYAALADKPIRANIPLVFIGIAPAVKEQGGLLVKVLHELEIEALPKDLPKKIDVDLSVLANIGDHINAGDIKLPTQVKSIAKLEDTVAVVETPKEEEKEEEQQQASVEDIKVSEEKGKKDDEGDEAKKDEQKK